MLDITHITQGSDWVIEKENGEVRKRFSLLSYQKACPFIVILYEILATFPSVIQDKDFVDYNISENTQLVKSPQHLVSQVMR